MRWVINMSNFVAVRVPTNTCLRLDSVSRRVELTYKLSRDSPSSFSSRMSYPRGTFALYLCRKVGFHATSALFTFRLNCSCGLGRFDACWMTGSRRPGADLAALAGWKRCWVMECLLLSLVLTFCFSACMFTAIAGAFDRPRNSSKHMSCHRSARKQGQLGRDTHSPLQQLVHGIYHRRPKVIRHIVVFQLRLAFQLRLGSVGSSHQV